MRQPRHDSTASVTLITLCIVAVLGIALASYIAAASRSMQFSSRSLQNGLGKQLAEAGIDEALRAYNKNSWADWSSGGVSVDWDVSTYASSKRATANFSIPARTFGSSVTGASVKIRVDNYDASHLGATWQSSTNYRIGDVVGRNGIWYRCVAPNSGQAPTNTGNIAYWVPDPIPWMWSGDIDYERHDTVNYNGVWYRAVPVTLSASGTIPTANANWSSIPANVTTWSSGTSYLVHDVVNYGGVNYRCTAPNTNQQPPNALYWSTTVNSISLSWTSGTVYTRGAMLFNSGSWYICTLSHLSGATFAGDAANWDSSDWNATLTYAVGDVVFYAGAWYSCKVSNINQLPTNTSFWNTAAYSASITYSSGQVVYYLTDGKWYRYMNGTAASGRTPSANVGSYWEDLSTVGSWSSSTTYKVGDRIAYNGVWYTCNNGHINRLPPNKLYWTATSFISWQYLPKNYQFNDVVCYGSSSLWYRRDVTNSTVAPPTNATYWDYALSGTTNGWSSGSIKYTLGDRVYYSGTLKWYRCVYAHTSSGTYVPDSTTYSYWVETPPLSTAWQPNQQYNQYDQVWYQGLWYLSLANTNYRNVPNEASSTHWAAAATPAAWDSTLEYSLNSIVSHSGIWYRCKTPHKNQAPPNTTYWNVLTGADYRWTRTAYSSGTYRSYAGAWYKCTSATTFESPNDTLHWTGSWPRSDTGTENIGAPVVYAESTLSYADGSRSKTQLRALLVPSTLFPNAAGSTTTLTITSATSAVDSYDGSVSSLNAAGYPATYAYGQNDGPFSNNPAWNKGYSAVLAANSTLTISGTTAVNGYLAWPTPPSGISTNTTVWGISSPTSPKVDPTRISRSPYIPQFDILPGPQTGVASARYLSTAFTSFDFPYGMALATNPTGTINIGTPGGIVPTRYYYNGALTLSASSSYQINNLNINGPVILYVNGNFRTRYVATPGEGTLKITSAGSAEIHVDGGIRSDANTGGFNNLTLDAKRLVIISDLASTTTQYLAATANPFYGVVYVPYTTATLGLEIRTGVTLYGALSAREITFSSEATLHYDTSLRNFTTPGVDQPYTVSDWRELTNASELATMP